jgi:hypothetical protein
MSLIRRKKKSKTAVDKAAQIAAVGAKGLAAQRVARKGHKHYKRGRKFLPLAVLAGIGAFVASKLGRKGAADAGTSWSPPASSSTPSPETTAAAAAATSSAVPQPTNGAPPADSDVEQVVEDAEAVSEAEEQKPAT